jgi:hypothetical protein
MESGIVEREGAWRGVAWRGMAWHGVWLRADLPFGRTMMKKKKDLRSTCARVRAVGKQ